MSIKQIYLIIALLLVWASYIFAGIMNFNAEEPVYQRIVLDSKDNPIIEISYRGHKPTMILQFDSSGNFLKERIDLKVLPGGPAFMDAEGNFWAADPQGDKQKIYKLDKENKISTVAEVKGFNKYFVNQKGALYFLRTISDKAELSQYNFDTKQENKLFTITDLINKNDPGGCAAMEYKPEIFFVVDSKGSNIAVLITGKHTAEVRIYTPEGELITRWKVVPDPFTPDSYINGISIDAVDLFYIIHSSRSMKNMQEALQNANQDAYFENQDSMHPSWQKGSIAQYDLRGKSYMRIKEHMGIPGSVAVSKRGYIYAAMLPAASINVYDKKGNFLYNWNAMPPNEKETWTQRREFEDSIRSINENSSSALLVQALIYGDGKTQAKARRFLLTREPSVLHFLMEAIKKNPNNWDNWNLDWDLISMAERITNLHGEEALSILKNEFSKEDEEGKESLVQIMARLTKNQLPEVTALVNKMTRENNSKAGAAITYVRMDENTVKSYLDWTADLLSAPTKNRLFYFQLFEHMNESFPALKKILLDPNSPIREQARALLMAGQYFGEAPCKDAPHELSWYAGLLLRTQRPFNVAHLEIPQTLKELKELTTSNDIFVRDTAIITLALNGFPGYEKQVLEAAHRNPALQHAAVTAIISSLENNKESIRSFNSEILGIIDEAINSLSPMDKATRENLAARGGRQAIRNARISYQSFEQLIREVAKLNVEEINKSLVHHVSEPDLPERAKLIILDVLNKKSFAYLAPDTIKLLELPLSPVLLRQIVENLATYKAKETSAKLIELYEKQKPKQNVPMKPENKSVQHEIIIALGAFQVKDNLPFLVSLFSTMMDCEMRLDIMKAICKIGGNEAAAPFLQSMLDDEQVGFFAALALAKKGDKTILPVLIEGLISNNEASEYVTTEAIEPLGQTGIDELIKLLDYPYEPVSVHAASLLAQLKVEKAKNKIIALYNNKDLIFDSKESEIMDAVLLFGEDPFLAYFERHDLDFQQPVGYFISSLKEQALAVNMLEHYLRPGAKTSEALNAITCLSAIKIPAGRTLLEHYSPPDDPHIKEALHNALLCPE